MNTMGNTGGLAESRVNELVEGFRGRLESCGTVCVASGELHWSGGRLSIHTDFGPQGQDKDTNQDFVLGWVAQGSSGIPWAVALADGVSSSFQAEFGARIACWAALAALVTGSDDFQRQSRRSLDAAGDAIGGLFEELTADPERFRPQGEFSSTWKYTLREGLLLQTTLSLAWMEAGVLNLVIVGDGGAALFGFGDEEAPRFLGGASAQTQRVHALGPLNRHVSAFDYGGRVDVEGTGLIALFTDGIARGIGADGAPLMRSAPMASPTSRDIIARLINERPREFEDNLTLALIECA